MQILITGGAGFIGCNAAEYFSKKGHAVHILDNLSRKGTAENLTYLKGAFPGIGFSRADTRDAAEVKRIVASRPWDAVLHFAGQVAVTTSTADPRTDFEINALGTFNVLEGMRAAGSEGLLIYSSTNKVYGELPSVRVEKKGTTYFFPDYPAGIPETVGLDFHSPYGCSKGCADQYVIDYARIYGLHTVAFRQSCIYGRHQYGIEDQGWVAWFTIAAIFNRPIAIYGDGLQARDVLYAGDLVRLYEKAIEQKSLVRGRAFNVGGGCGNVMSLKELIARLEKRLGKTIPLSYADWRPGDQKVYVSDISLAQRVLGWQPEVGIDEGLEKLAQWAIENEATLKSIGLFDR